MLTERREEGRQYYEHHTQKYDLVSRVVSPLINVYLLTIPLLCPLFTRAPQMTMIQCVPMTGVVSALSHHRCGHTRVMV